MQRCSENCTCMRMLKDYILFEAVRSPICNDRSVMVMFFSVATVSPSYRDRVPFVENHRRFDEQCRLWQNVRQWNMEWRRRWRLVGPASCRSRLRLPRYIRSEQDLNIKGNKANSTKPSSRPHVPMRWPIPVMRGVSRGGATRPAVWSLCLVCNLRIIGWWWS